MKKFIKGLLREVISASEAHTTTGSIQTIVDGKRNVGFMQLNKREVDYVSSLGLKLIKVPSNKYDSYVVFKSGYESDAMELLEIAEKHDGYLSHKASDDVTRRIGQILGYNVEDIEKHIKDKNKN